MFFELMDHSSEDRPHFGFLIAKNPDSEKHKRFEKSLGSQSDSITRRVVGGYKEGRRDTYCITVENDALGWMQKLRDENKPHYVSSAPFVVSPTNLKGIGVALKSALDGKNVSGGAITDEEVQTPREWTAVLGPFALPKEFVIERYRELLLDVWVVPDKDDEVPDELKYLGPLTRGGVVTVRLGACLPLVTFLQKVIVGAYALTVNQHSEKYLADALVLSLMNASKEWLGSTELADWVIGRLSRGSKQIAGQWAEAVKVEGEENAEEPEAKEESKGQSLHERRHEVILKHVPLTEDLEGATQSLRVVDLGCGDGKLTLRLLQEREGAKVLSIDADDQNLEWLKRKVRRAFRTEETRSIALDIEGIHGRVTAALQGEVFEGPFPDVLAEVEKAFNKVPPIKRRFSVRRDSAVTPYLEESDTGPDVLILSEVIEHMITADRWLLVKSISNLWRVKRIILTTPNREYNVVWPNIAEGEFRHPDHKVEYDFADLEREVLRPLREQGYAVRIVPVLTHADSGGPFTLLSRPTGDGLEGYTLDTQAGWDALIQPSWVVVADRKPDVQSNNGPMYYARGLHEPVHLHETGYTVSFPEMIEGLCSPVYRSHREMLAFLAPTLAPVEHDPLEFEYLEHPLGAFEYYRKRGVDTLVGEKKYMGSRMTLVAFKDHDAAREFGYPFAKNDAPLYAWSRKGYPFFDDRTTPWQLHDDLVAGGFFDDDHVLVIDGELMPWSHKAGKGEKNLITQQFQTPGEAALVDAVYKGNVDGIDLALRFLDALAHHTKQTPLRFVPFDVLARGRVRPGQAYLHEAKLGSLVPRHMTLRWLADKVRRSGVGRESMLQYCDWHIVTLETPHSMSDSIHAWKDYCEEGGEGFVYKPLEHTVLRDGAPIQPALKVRGRDYLRLIYGMNYMEEGFFEKVCKRNVSAKRRLALQENTLSDRILRAFIRGEQRRREKYIAAFLGADGIQGRELDATL